MDQQEETAVSVVTTVEFDDINYGGKTLLEWETALTIEMPEMPCTSDEIDKVCADLNNKYQIAYNTYNRLFITYKELQSRCRMLLLTKVELLVAELAGKGRLPGRDRLEDMCRNKYPDIQRHEERLTQISILKEWFDHNRNKLKDTMQLTNSLSYSANQSDRMFDKSSRSNGM